MKGVCEMSTIQDVAKKAGVSVATVSRVMNGINKVKPETEKAVKEAIQALNYMPNMSARNLRKNESRLILVVARNFTNPFYSHLVSAINESVSAAGYNMLMCKNNGDYQETLKYFRMIENKMADGMILLNCTVDDTWMQSFGGKYPIIQCCEYVEGFQNPKVYIDHRKMGYQITEYLIAQGHKRIAYISADNKHISTFQRREGYYQAMKDAGLEQFISEYCVDGDYSFHDGVRCAKEILEAPERPTAVACVADMVALGLILGIQELGYRVPEDISVVGVDDVDYTMMKHPFLTTIHIPCEELGRKSAQMLLQCLDGEMPEDVCVEADLVIRETVSQRIIP